MELTCQLVNSEEYSEFKIKPVFLLLPFKQASSSCPHLCRTSATAVVSLAILPRTVIFRRMVSITKYSISSITWTETCG